MQQTKSPTVRGTTVGRTKRNEDTPIRDAVPKSDTKKAETHKASPLCWTSAGRRILHLRFPFGSVGSHFRPQRPRTVYVMPLFYCKYSRITMPAGFVPHVDHKPPDASLCGHRNHSLVNSSVSGCFAAASFRLTAPHAIRDDAPSSMTRPATSAQILPDTIPVQNQLAPISIRNTPTTIFPVSALRLRSSCLAPRRGVLRW